MHSCFIPICRSADQDVAAAKVAVISDLHIGSHQTKYEKLWDSLLSEFRKGIFNTLVITGDFADYREQGSEKLTEILKQRLDEAVTIKPPIHIHVLRGNNDTVTPFNDLLISYMQSPESKKRFTYGDVLLMGKDVAFIHGDEDLFSREREMHSPQEVQDYWKGKVRKNGNFSDAATYEEKIAKVDELLKQSLNGQCENIQHVFMGHIHPREAILSHQCAGKHYHVTNPPFIDAPATFIALEFDKEGYAKTPHIMHFNAVNELTEYTPQSAFRAVG